MSAPAIEIQTVEDIDLTPVCTGKLHKGDSPAQLRIEHYGCTVHLFCLDCEAYDRKVIKGAIATGNHAVWCDHCRRRFWSYESIYTRVVPL